MASEKKKRSSNFTLSEKRKLIGLVGKYRNTVENKQTDAVSVKEKDSCWIKMCTEFDCDSLGENRNTESLKKCWENLKKKTRKHFSELRRDRFATGGGTMSFSEDPICDRVREIIQPSVDGLDNPFDCDHTPDEFVTGTVKELEENKENEGNCREHVLKEESKQNEGSFEECVLQEVLDEAFDCQADWTNWNPIQLRKKKSKQLDTRQIDENLLYDDIEAAVDRNRQNNETAIDRNRQNNETTINRNRQNNETAIDGNKQNDETTIDRSEKQNETTIGRKRKSEKQVVS